MVRMRLRLAGTTFLQAVLSALILALWATFVPAGAAEEQVDVELVLAVDVSYSMDLDELALQRDGSVIGVDVETELPQTRYRGFEHLTARRQHQSVVAVRRTD